MVTEVGGVTPTPPCGMSPVEVLTCLPWAMIHVILSIVGVYRILGPRFGDFDAGRVTDLGLPTFTATPGLAGPVVGRPARTNDPPN